jgi:hypothetical protein
MPETDRLWNTIFDWWNEVETLRVTGVTNARNGGCEYHDQEHQTDRSRRFRALLT